MDLFRRSSSAGGELCHLKCQWKGSFPAFFSILAVFSLFDLQPLIYTSGDVREAAGCVCGGGYLTLTGSCQVKMRRSILQWFADTLLLGVQIITVARILMLIPWFLDFFFFFFLALRFCSHHSTAKQGGGRLLERSWQVEKCESTCVLVLWGRRAGNITAVGRNMTAYKTRSEFSMWQIASVCAPRPHPRPHCLSFWDEDFQKQEIHKDSQKDADATSQSHLPTQQHKLRCVFGHSCGDVGA